MIPTDVLKAFDNLCSPDKPLVWVATNGIDGPHLVPVCFVKALGEGKLLIGNVFIRETERNIELDPRVAVSVAFKGEEGWNGYMLKGRAEVLRKDRAFDEFKLELLVKSKGKREIASAIQVNVREAFSLAPRKGKKRLG